ncbi:MAG: hypothetical protein OXL37_11830 [Chloroflexota bacterium]|nr:hypothetical protein [Chloroflexota bacterium]MDE2958721.1 hypothetical protein [Chloroflexota bacterium]
MSSRTRKWIRSAPLLAALAVVGVWAIFAAPGTGGASANLLSETAEPPPAQQQTALAVAITGDKTEMKRHETVQLTATVTGASGSRPLRYEWRRVIGRNSDTNRWEYEVIGRARTRDTTHTINWTASGIGFRGELHDALRRCTPGFDCKGDQVHINVRVWDGPRMKKSQRFEITIRNTVPTVENAMQVQPWPSFWIGPNHQDYDEFCPDGSNGCFLPVTLIIAACDEDDPIWFDRVTHGCEHTSGAGMRRKPQSYLHVLNDGAKGMGFSWFVLDEDKNAIDVGILEPFEHAPWQANFTPPADAQNGDVFTMGIILLDPDADVDQLREILPNPLEITVQAVGKPEPEPEPEPGDFTVSVSVDATGIKVGQIVTATCDVAAGDPEGALTYRWTANDDDGLDTEGQPDPRAPGWFNHIDRAEVAWMAIRPNSEVRLTCQATDEAGGTAEADSQPITVSLK